MELIYAYVEEYKILNEIPFITHPLFDVSYNNGCLNIRGKDQLIINYYDGVAIKAIVGRNGCGKSTFFEFIEEGFDYTESSGFMVWLNKNESVFIIQAVNYDFETTTFDLCYNFSIVSMDVNYLKKIKHNIVKVNNLNALSLPKKNKRNGIIDLSLSKQNYFNGNARNSNLRNLITFFNESSWIDSKAAKYRYNFSFKKPSSAIKNWAFKIFCKERSDVENYIRKGYFSEKYAFIFQPPDILNESAGSTSDIFQLIFERNLFSFIRYILATNIVDEVYAEILVGKVLNYIDKYNFIQANDFLELVDETYIIWLKDKMSINVTEYDSQIIINNMIHIFDTLYDMAGLISEHISVTGGITSNCSFHINDFEVIEALLDLLSSLPKQVSNNFSYGWEGFSTGELAKLNIFSSIYNYMKKSISFTTLFILDEVDLYLHPEWQRTFISELISFLKSETDTSTIQLLISTHSPLIIGDFLPEDIISLQNNNDGHTYVTEAYGFGTEITDAYISGMHISSTFGEHSREKLLKLIDSKLNGELRDEDSWLISKLKDSSIKRMLTK